MKIRVAVNVTVNKKDPRYCGRCHGLADNVYTGGMRCAIFGGGDLVDEYESGEGYSYMHQNIRRCRACITNRIPSKGMKKK
jgi:hypothetical protein